MDTEIHSRVGFTADPAAARQSASVWHLDVAAGDPPAATYRPLAKLIRPSAAQFSARAAVVQAYADLRPDRVSETIAQLAGPHAFLGSVAFVSPDRTPWTVEVLAAAYRFAIFVEVRLKHALACRRPIEYSPQLQPMILTPAHGTMPSGHATESFIMALVLWRLISSSGGVYAGPLWGAQLMRTAARIAHNREVAGVHFATDSKAGALLGLTLGQYLVERCSNGAGYRAWQFDGRAFPDTGEFFWSDLFDLGTGVRTGGDVAALDTAVQPLGARSDILEWMWAKAKAEWP
jgi:membrane-associated phospholipid phosphatase